MFAHITGALSAIQPSTAVVDVGGLGFKLGMSANSLAALGPIGSDVKLYTSLIVREDALDLYGFIDVAERSLFEQLISVSGVGPKVALSVLSSFTPEDFQKSIIAGDAKRLTAVPGLGKKTAQRLILELEGTLVDFERTDVPGSKTRKVSASIQATDALLGMGFTKQEIELASKGYSGPDEDVEKQVRYILQRLGGA